MDLLTNTFFAKFKIFRRRRRLRIRRRGARVYFFRTTRRLSFFLYGRVNLRSVFKNKYRLRLRKSKFIKRLRRSYRVLFKFKHNSFNYPLGTNLFFSEQYNKNRIYKNLKSLTTYNIYFFTTSKLLNFLRDKGRRRTILISTSYHHFNFFFVIYNLLSIFINQITNLSRDFNFSVNNTSISFKNPKLPLRSIITRKYKFLPLKTWNLKTFVLFYLGLFLPLGLNFKKFIKLPRTFTIRKKLYSFLKINELKYSLFSHKRKLTVIKFLKKINKHSLPKNFFLRSCNLFSFFSYKSRSLLPLKLLNSNNYHGSYSGDRSSIYSNNRFYKVSPITRYKRTSPAYFKLSRIRFKPGYQRLWRNFRLALAESINLKYTYQQQLTKYLTKFYRKCSSNSFHLSENTLDKIILLSKIIPDYGVLNLFLTNNYIFINHVSVSDPLIFIYKNDFLQVEISIWFYIYSKWMLSWLRYRNGRFKRLVFKKSLSGRYKVMKRRKQRSYYTPNWIFKVRFDFLHVKSFLEVDYLTLSVFIIYDFSFFYFFKPNFFYDNKQLIYRLYNWKYQN